MIRSNENLSAMQSTRRRAFELKEKPISQIDQPDGWRLTGTRGQVFRASGCTLVVR